MEKTLIFGDFAVKVSKLQETNQTWNDILKAYLEDFMLTVKAKDYWKAQVQRQIQTIGEWFRSQGIVLYEDLTREKARTYVEWRGKMSASTLNKELMRIRMVIKFSERFLSLPTNFAFEGINVGETQENTKLVVPFSIDECKAILEWLKKRKPYYHDAILLMLITGIESKAMTLMSKDWWHIKENLLFVFPHKISGVIDAKNQHRARKIPISKTMLEIYKREYIFTEPRSKRSFSQKAHRLLNICMEETGITEIHCHRFRHTFASQILSAGYDAVRVSKLLGHKGINITLKHYADFIFGESNAGFEGMLKIHKEWVAFLNEEYFDADNNADNTENLC